MTIYNDQIAATMRQYNLTHEQVAEGACVSVHTVSAWLSGKGTARWRRVRPERVTLLLAWIDRRGLEPAPRERESTGGPPTRA